MNQNPTRRSFDKRHKIEKPEERWRVYIAWVTEILVRSAVTECM